VRQYLAGRSLWLDEAMLADGVVSRSAGELLTRPLPGHQVAPIGTVLLMHASTRAIGATDWAIRLVPFVAGIALVVLAADLATSMLRSAAARACLLGLVAGAPALVYYSAEAKPYVIDATATLALLTVAVSYRQGLRRAVLTGMVAPWLSQTALFAMAAVGAVRLGDACRERPDSRELRGVLGMLAAWLVSAAAATMVTMRSVEGNQTMARYWRGAFAPSPFAATGLDWYRGLVNDLVAMTFVRAGPAGVAPGLAWSPWLDIALPLGAVAGLLALLLMHTRLALAVALTLAVALVASAVGGYPLSGRLLLFAVPLVLVMLAGLVDWMSSPPGVVGQIGGWIAAIALLALVVRPAATIARHPIGGSDVKGALAYVSTHARRYDRLALSEWSVPAVSFYRPHFALDGLLPAPSVSRTFDAPAFLRDARGRGMLGRTWVVFSHRFELRHRFLGPMYASATLVDRWEGDGAGAYLFDLRER
jgi:hypothetical protein